MTRVGRFQASSCGNTASIDSFREALPLLLARREPTWFLSKLPGCAHVPRLPKCEAFRYRIQVRCGTEDPGWARAGQNQATKSPRVRLHSPARGCSRASGIESGPPLFQWERYVSFCSSFARLHAQNAARGEECPPGARAEEE